MALIRMGASVVVVVYVVVTTVVLVAGANENWPMVACESLDFGRLRAPRPWLLEDMVGSKAVCRGEERGHGGLAFVRVTTGVRAPVFVRFASV